MLNKRKVVLLLILSLNVINGCSTTPNSSVNTPKETSKLNSNLNENITIKGTVQFPDFKIKATLSEIAPKATVSLIYPSDYPIETLRNTTVASGLTNASGQFSLNVQSGFTPQVGKVYVLEAIKRIGGAGNNALSLRTHLKWTGSGFESITDGGIFINTKTTALAIMSSLGEVSAQDTIKKMSVNNGIIEVSDINQTITAGRINSVKGLVEEALINNNDPVASIVLNNGVYSIKENASINLPPTLGCIGEPQDCSIPQPSPSVEGCVGETCPSPTPTPSSTTNPTPTPISPTPEPTPTSVPTPIAFVGEYKVNTTTLETQQNVKTAYYDSGYVVVWESNLQDTSGYGIYAQRYDINGAKIGEEFRVNSFIVNDQNSVSVASDNAGNFTVVWKSPQDGSGTGIYMQRYNSSGQALGVETKVNTYTTGDQSAPNVSMNDNGDILIVWQSNQDGSGYGIYSQKYNSSGQLIGSETKVNTTTSGNQMFPSADLSNGGRAIVTWQSADANLSGVFAHILDVNGQPLEGSDIAVNTYTTDNQDIPVAGIDVTGNFTIVWRSKLQDGDGLGIYAQRYDIAGIKAGEEFKVNTTTVSDQSVPSISMSGSGKFVISWQSNLQDGSGTGIYMQRYDNLGQALGVETKVNTYTNSNQMNPNVSMNNAGNVNIVWQSYLQDGSLYGVFAQRYDESGAKK